MIGNFDLTRVFRFPQRDHRIGLGSPVPDAVVREHDANEQRLLVLFLPFGKTLDR